MDEFFGYTLRLRDDGRFQSRSLSAASRQPGVLAGLAQYVLVALASALVPTAVGMLLGWIISRSRIRFRHVLDFISVLSGRFRRSSPASG
jgi:ABC-type Fe3+ transport system permease subunit